MTIHYHGTPINPVAKLYGLAGRCFCVSFYDPRQVARCHEIGQSVMLDNGAYSRWKAALRGEAVGPFDWEPYYSFCDRWLASPTTWAVIPDVIDGGIVVQEALLLAWPHGVRGAPVWHMDEPIERLLRLVDAWPRVCVGSTSVYADVLSDAWRRRMDLIFDAVAGRGRMPWLHMLRGMACVGKRWPFASVDSTDIARNHHRAQNVRAMAERWDRVQCARLWRQEPEQLVMPSEGCDHNTEQRKVQSQMAFQWEP